MMRLLCLCLHVWVSVLSLSIESSPAAHIITQIDTKYSPGKTLLGHKERHPQCHSQHKRLFYVFIKMSCLMFSLTFIHDDIAHLFHRPI